MNNEYIKVLFLGFIFLIHIGVLNIIEKILMKKLINTTTITNRPLDKCINSNDFDISCIGMPSGHTESATIISLLLFITITYGNINNNCCWVTKNYFKNAYNPTSISWFIIWSWIYTIL
jgi:hypothetical protein